MDIIHYHKTILSIKVEQMELIIMKVKCVKVLDSDGNITNNSYWLKLESIYYVIEIYMYPYEGILYRIIDYNISINSYSLVLKSPECFETVSEIVPSNWKIDLSDNCVTITTESWAKDNFWVAYFDGEPWAEDIFEKELQIMLDEDP